MKKNQTTPKQSQGNLDSLYSPLQQKVLNYAINNDFFMLINHGAKRSGKTMIDNDIFLFELRRIRKLADSMGVKQPQYILAGSDLSSLQRNVLIELSNKYDIEFKFDKYNRFQLFGVLVCCFGHSKINDLGRVRGMTAWGAYINEATMANEQVFDEIKSRCSAPGARIIMDTNPDRPSHWLKVDYIDKAKEKDNIAEFQWKLTDNTFIDKAAMDNMMTTTPSGMFYDRNINGMWVAAQGVIYPDFDRNIHYVSKDSINSEDIEKYWCGQDFGWEHPGAIVLFGRTYSGCTYLLKEWSGKHKNIKEWAKIVKDTELYTGRLTVYCDSARPDLIDDMLCAGIDARMAHKDVVAGIGEVATMWKNKTLYVVEDNVDLFKEEIETYVWKDGADEPVKVHDDVMDAVRYAIYSERVEREEVAELNDSAYLRGGF